jgi:outer membrane protein
MKRSVFMCLFIAALSVQAQDILTVEGAIDLALKNNYDIAVARDEASISSTNNTPGAAGMLPIVGISGSANYSIRSNGTKQSREADFENTSSGIATYNAGVELAWTIFDGGKMFVSKSKLNEIENLGEIQFKNQVMNTLGEVIAAYFNIVKQEQLLAALNQTIEYTLERVKIAETGFNAGSKKKTDLLQAKIDLNVNRENAINQEGAIKAAKLELARLLLIDNYQSFTVSSEFTFDYTPEKDELRQKIDQQNLNLLANQKQLEIGQLALQEKIRSQMPKLNLTSGYYYQNTNSSVFTNNTYSAGRSLWPQIGGALSIPVYQGGLLKRQVALARIDVDLARLNLENNKLLVNTDLENALTAFENQQRLLEIERENIALAKENLEISIQRMRFGEATSLEVRMAQTDFEQSASRLTTFKYNLKLAETKLKQLMGEL